MSTEILIILGCIIALIAIILGAIGKIWTAIINNRVFIAIAVVSIVVLLLAFGALVFSNSANAFANCFGIIILGALVGVAYLLFRK